MNRITRKHFSAELDVLTHLGGSVYDANDSGTYHQIVLQNIALGYKIPSPNRNVEVFVNSRNLAWNKKADIVDGRRYYGLGVKIDLSK